MEDLKSQLIRDARAKGICADGYATMYNLGEKSLVDYYIQNPDWCLERDYPTLSFLKENFSGIESKGVFIGRRFHGELLDRLDTYIFHNCSGTIKVGLNIEQQVIPRIYAANRCRLRIVGVGEITPKEKKNRTLILVDSFGDNEISAKSNKWVEFKTTKNPLL